MEKGLCEKCGISRQLRVRDKVAHNLSVQPASIKLIEQPVSGVFDHDCEKVIASRLSIAMTSVSVTGKESSEYVAIAATYLSVLSVVRE